MTIFLGVKYYKQYSGVKLRETGNSCKGECAQKWIPKGCGF